MGDGQTTSWPNGSGRATLKCGFGYSYLAIWGGFYFFGFKFFLMFLMSIFFFKKNNINKPYRTSVKFWMALTLIAFNFINRSTTCINWMYTGTKCNTFWNRGSHLIMSLTTCTKKVTNPKNIYKLCKWVLNSQLVLCINQDLNLPLKLFV
jgi:hypothetical protein